MSPADIQIINLMMTFGSGALGVGIGIGAFRSWVKQIKLDLAKIQKRQARLRGEDNGDIPVYMTRNGCLDLRTICGASHEVNRDRVTVLLDKHTKSIKGLENFARWFLQDKGLTIKEINEILERN